MSKKALVITDMNDQLLSYLPEITKKNTEDLMILKSYGSEITQPYGCMMRNVLLAVYRDKIEEIYIVGEHPSEPSMNKHELLSKIHAAGISNETIKAIEYFNIVGNDLLGWLVGTNDVKETIRKNMELIQSHPFIPDSIHVYGCIVDLNKEDFSIIEEKVLKPVK